MSVPNQAAQPVPEESKTSASKTGTASARELDNEVKSSSDKELGFSASNSGDDKFLTTRREIWAYYAYYVGNNGLSLFNFAPTQSQNLLSLAADPNTGTLQFMGAQRSVNSIVLLANGISFAIQCALFLIIGSYADFGHWRPNILIVASLVAYGIGFGWLGVADPSKWRQGVGLYMVGLIAYQTCLTFWNAAFPGLARDTPQIREKQQQLSDGAIETQEYHREESLMRSRLSNVAFYVQSCAELIILAIIVGIMFSLHVNDGDAQNTWGLSVLIAFASGVWLLVSIPWFVLEKRRPGIKPKMNIVLAGLLQLWVALSKIWKLKQSLIYLIGIAAQGAGIGSFWYIQKRFGLSVKTMFNAIALSIVILDGWGMLGIWQQNFGA
ncbi:MAG: hypothetical protein Q9162_005714 [Coniocarpon cinnabarinum]